MTNEELMIEAANSLADAGFAPFVPHMTHFWHMIFPRPYEFWLDLDNQFLPVCDALLRLPGDSSGADNGKINGIRLSLEASQNSITEKVA